ncbi:extracellular calcium-sensing receptor-like [Hyla sarda]|uniref:extracellular calcium-sensing receptor-like n=1 Tax=Hyla sarda TaxID=327740 RepID=UPI0024C2E7CA|nr:extracellular calcium-sensing receptor-like [Hyla sarda]
MLDTTKGSETHFMPLQFSFISNPRSKTVNQIFHTEQYKSLLMFMLTIDEINKNPELLPNVTLGYHIFDTCGNSRKSIKSAIQILSGKNKETPNYSDHGKVAAFVLSSGFHTNMALTQFLSLYRFTQVSKLMGDIVNIDKSGKSVYFSKERKVLSEWKLANNMVWYGTTFPTVNATIVGTFEDSEQEEKKLNIDLGKMIWKNDKISNVYSPVVNFFQVFTWTAERCKLSCSL